VHFTIDTLTSFPKHMNTLCAQLPEGGSRKIFKGRLYRTDKQQADILNASDISTMKRYHIAMFFLNRSLH